MRAADIMTSDVISVAADTTVRALAELLCQHRISGAPVIDGEGRVIGMVSEGDLLHRAETGTEHRHSWWLETFASARELAREYVKSHGRNVQDIMTTPVIAVREDTPLDEIADTLEKHRIKRVPVLRDGKPVGIVSRANLVRALAMTKPEAQPGQLDDREIRAKLLAEIRHQKWAETSPANILVKDRVVHLWSEYMSDEARHALQVAAEGIPGVAGVEHHVLDTLVAPPM